MADIDLTMEPCQSGTIPPSASEQLKATPSLASQSRAPTVPPVNVTVGGIVVSPPNVNPLITNPLLHSPTLPPSCIIPPSLIPVLRACVDKQLRQSHSANIQLPTQHRPPAPAVTPSTLPDHTTPPDFNFNVKVIRPDKKKEFQTFVLRNVKPTTFTTLQGLRKELCRQFGEGVISNQKNFTLGYMKNGFKVTAQSSADIDEIWKLTLKGESITLWCYGKSLKPIDDDSDSDEACTDDSSKKKKKRKMTSLEEKNERVEEILAMLKQKHSSNYTSIQFRLWAEMIDVGTHKSLDCPPGLPAFTGRERRTSPVANLTNVVGELAKAITYQQGSKTLDTPSTSVSQVVSTGISPGKIANLRSNYLQQMRELHTLFECGAITQVEYAEQKKPILEQLKRMNPQ